ncbi:MAG: helix-turn-helix domain-containing protein [Planctomycetes bacterium]|nr:helix-turn-helix domain-containing protein [Planctomycetota bacterium]
MKDILTTGEVARLCGVAPRTVTKWFDAGSLRGYKIPGSRDRRIPRDSLIRFMKAHGIPLRGLDGGTTRVLIVDAEYDSADALRAALESGFNYDVQVACGVFEAGLLARQVRPHVLLLDTNLPGLNPREMRLALRSDPELVATKVVAVEPHLSDERMRVRMSEGFDACLAKPYNLATAVRVIEEATNLVA